MISRKKIKFTADPKRVILRPFFPGNETRARHVIDRIMSMPEHEVILQFEEVIRRFKNRHRNFEEALLANYNRISGLLPQEIKITEARKLLTGSYFTHEYSIESAALFNPSIVPHPDQSGLKEGELRFVMSLRATGEGHISSIEFRSGIIDKSNNITFDETTSFAAMASSRKERVETEIELVDESAKDANYDISFTGKEPISERVIFPFSKTESNGIEDVRFVLFKNEDGTSAYYGTFTAYDGHRILPELIRTNDFVNFKIRTMQGAVVRDKGMALFPEKINGRYAFISRIDGENLYYMESDNLYQWEDAKLLRGPFCSWEYTQIGNCGSPIETEKGWLLITHAVGPVRRYVISAILLDKEDPSKVIGYLDKPLIEPDEEEREGYVPNVVYSCGSLLHNNELIIPYAMSDSASTIGSVPLNKVLEKIIPVKY
jgi:predicted GH43/DUF377 family glycosyl hydrolase